MDYNRLKYRTWLAFAVVLLPAFWSGCGSESGGGEPLTFVASRRALISSVASEGTVEARRSYALLAPRVRGYRQLEISYLATEGSYLQKDDIVVEFNSEPFRASLEQALGALETARSELAMLDAEQESRIAQLESQIKRSEASIESSRLKLAELEFVAPREREIRELQIERSAIEAAKSRKKLESIREVHREERSQHLLRIRQEESKCEEARANMEQLVLRAPVAGYVQYGDNRMTDSAIKPGDNVFAGWPVATIPDISSMQVILQLSETQVQNMETGQAVEVVLESLDGMKLAGKVSWVAQVARPVSRNSNVKTVEVEVTIDETARGLVPGLTAGCTIIKQKVEDALVVPLETVFEQDSARVVYALAGSEFAMKKVELGARGDNFAVVLSGLEGGEKLALRQPAQSMIAR